MCRREVLCPQLWEPSSIMPAIFDSSDFAPSASLLTPSPLQHPLKGLHKSVQLLIRVRRRHIPSALARHQITLVHHPHEHHLQPKTQKRVAKEQNVILGFELGLTEPLQDSEITPGVSSAILVLDPVVGLRTSKTQCEKAVGYSSGIRFVNPSCVKHLSVDNTSSIPNSRMTFIEMQSCRL